MSYSKTAWQSTPEMVGTPTPQDLPAEDVSNEDDLATGSMPLRLARRLERYGFLDRLGFVGEWLSRLVDKSGVERELRGRPIGHALHPLLTDLPLGCWTASVLLDVSGPGSRRAAQRLVGWGLVLSVPTAAAGAAEWRGLPNRAARRVTTAHAIGNAAVILMYLRSWLARRDGRQLTGMTWSLAGGLMAVGTGYLGGHLSFVLGSGQGERH